jgi:predicted RNA binding protein YcfA (HicA-like mRNA interferase family)
VIIPRTYLQFHKQALYLPEEQVQQQQPRDKGWYCLANHVKYLCNIWKHENSKQREESITSSEGYEKKGKWAILTKYYGFEIKRQSGSHILIRHPINGRTVVVPRSHKDRPVKLGTLKDIIKQAGITEEDFIKHL